MFVSELILGKFNAEEEGKEKRLMCVISPIKGCSKW
jgi:hypothetical protein